MFYFIPVACKAEGIQRMGTETVDTSKKKDLKITIISFSLCSSSVMLTSSVITGWYLYELVLYLRSVWVLLRNNGIVGVLCRSKLLLLTVGNKYRCQLVALVGEQQLWPLRAERTSHLRVQVHHLWGEQHLRRLLLQNERREQGRGLEKENICFSLWLFEKVQLLLIWVALVVYLSLSKSCKS